MTGQPNDTGGINELWANQWRACDGPSVEAQLVLDFLVTFCVKTKSKRRKFCFVTFPLMKSNQKSRQNNASFLRAFTRSSLDFRACPP